MADTKGMSVCGCIHDKNGRTKRSLNVPVVFLNE